MKDLPPPGIEFLKMQIASLNGEVSACYDQIRAQAQAHVTKDGRIAELEAEVAKLKNPEPDGA